MTRNLQSWTKYLRQTLVLMSNRALRDYGKKFNFCFSEFFCQYWKNIHFEKKIEILLIFPNFVRSSVWSHSANSEAIVYTMFITNNHTSFYLWWKENRVKHQDLSKYYDHECLKNFLLLFMSLITALLLKIHTISQNLLNLSKNALDQTWKSFYTSFGAHWKVQKSGYQAGQVLALFYKLIPLTFG